jgi:hypothetical protein
MYDVPHGVPDVETSMPTLGSGICGMCHAVTFKSRVISARVLAFEELEIGFFCLTVVYSLYIAILEHVIVYPCHS